jgi:hypothetical protein
MIVIKFINGIFENGDCLFDQQRSLLVEFTRRKELLGVWNLTEERLMILFVNKE